MKKNMKKFFTCFLAVLMALNLTFFDAYDVKANIITDDAVITLSENPISGKKPKISVKINENSVEITIKKTENAEGYLIYTKAPGSKEY